MMRMLTENRKKDEMSLRTLIREMTTFPPLLLRHMKFPPIENGQMTMVQVTVILSMKEHKGAVRMNELADMMSSSMPTMTGIITRLVEKGIVERGDDPSDRRVVTVQLTKEGEKIAGSLFGMIESFWSSVILQLNKSEREDCVRIIRKIKAILSSEVKK